MKIRFYLAPQIGTGTMIDPFRSVITEYVTKERAIQYGEWFDERDCPARKISITCVHADQEIHDLIAADSRAIPIGLLMDDGAQLKTHLDSEIGSLPNVNALKTALEDNGISTSWLSAGNTIRDGIRYLLRVFVTSQKSLGNNNDAMRQLIASNLTRTVGEIPAQIRNAIRTWMQNRGLAIGWINNSTTVREILHFIIMNLGYGKYHLSGEEF